MLERQPVLRLIKTLSAGRKRVVTVYYSPLFLRHELHYEKEVVQTFYGSIRRSEELAVQRAREFVGEIRLADKERIGLHA